MKNQWCGNQVTLPGSERISVENEEFAEELEIVALELFFISLNFAAILLRYEL